jgi:hypothetical protein
MAVGALTAKIKVCMFDQYGTVVDMQKGLTEVGIPYLRKKGWGGRPDAFVTWWRRTHFENSMIDALLHIESTRHTGRLGTERSPTRLRALEFHTRWTKFTSWWRRSSG